MKGLIDPTIYYFTFWLCSSDFDNNIRLIEIIKNAWQSVHQNVENQKFEIWNNGCHRRESIRLVGTDWIPQNGESFLLEARTLLDSAYLQIGICANGIHRDKIFDTLQAKIETVENFSTAADKQICFGRTICYYAELQDRSNQPSLAQIFFQTLSSNDSQEIITYSFNWGSINVSTSDLNTFLVFTDRDKKNIVQTSHFINFILPRLMLSKLKAETEYADYENRLRKEIESAESELSNKLKGREETGTLDYLEDRTLKLSYSQDSLVEKLAEVNKKLITLKANVRNIELVLQDSILSSQKERLFARFGENLKLACEQIDLDLNYFKSKNEEACLALQTLQTFVDIERGKTERLILLIMGIVGLIVAMGDALAEIPILFRILMITISLIGGIGAWVIKQKSTKEWRK